MAIATLSAESQRVRQTALDNYARAHDSIHQLQCKLDDNEPLLNKQETNERLLTKTVSAVEQIYTFICDRRHGVIHEIEKNIKNHAVLIGALYVKVGADEPNVILELKERVQNQQWSIESHHRMLMGLQAQLDKLSKTDGPPRTVDAHAHNLTDFTNATALQYTQSSTEYNI